MPLLKESLILYKREMLIFKSSLRTNLIRTIIFPFVIILFFGNIGSSISNTPIAVVNYANNAQSTQFLNSLEAAQLFRIDTVTDQNTALGMLQLGSVQMVVVILPSFPSSNANVPGVQVYYANTQPTVVAAVLPVINQAAQQFEPGGAGSAAASVQKQTSQVTSSPAYSAKSRYLDFLTAGIIGMVVIFGGLFVGGLSLIADRQGGNTKAFLITPIDKNAIVFSKMLSGATQSVLSAVIAIGIGLLFGVNIALGPAALLYIIPTVTLLGFGFSGMAIALATRVNKPDAFAVFAQAFSLPLWFISGGITPVSSLPSWLIPASVVDPLTYAADVNRAVVMQGFISSSQLITDFSVMIVFAVAMVALGFISFKSTIE